MEEKYDKCEIELLKKIDSGEELIESELKLLVHEYGFKPGYEENRRWSRGVTTISELCGRYFATYWDEGLTEYQEDEFYNQPVEVERLTYEKTITVTEWKEINKKGE